MHRDKHRDRDREREAVRGCDALTVGLEHKGAAIKLLIT